jgi:hypothetical protein
MKFSLKFGAGHLGFQTNVWQTAKTLRPAGLMFLIRTPASNNTVIPL